MMPSSLSLMTCSTQDKEPCTSPRQQSIPDPIEGSTGKLAREYEHGKPGPFLHLTFVGMGGGEKPATPYPFMIE